MRAAVDKQTGLSIECYVRDKRLVDPLRVCDVRLDNRRVATSVRSAIVNSERKFVFYQAGIFYPRITARSADARCHWFVQVDTW